MKYLTVLARLYLYNGKNNCPILNDKFKFMAHNEGFVTRILL